MDRLLHLVGGTVHRNDLPGIIGEGLVHQVAVDHHHRHPHHHHRPHRSGHHPVDRDLVGDQIGDLAVAVSTAFAPLPAKLRQRIPPDTQIPHRPHHLPAAGLDRLHRIGAALLVPLFPKAGQHRRLAGRFRLAAIGIARHILPFVIRADSRGLHRGAAVLPRLPPQLAHRLALGNQDIRLGLHLVAGRVAEIYILHIQRLTGDVPANRHRTGMVGIQPGGDPVIPVSVQQTGTGLVRVAQHRFFHLLQPHAGGGHLKILRQRRHHRRHLRLLQRAMPAVRLTGDPIAQRGRRSRCGNPLGGVPHRHRCRPHHRHFVFADSLDDIVPHQRPLVAAVGAAPLIAREKTLVDAVLLVQPAPPQRRFECRALLILPEHLFRGNRVLDQMLTSFLLSSAPRRLWHRRAVVMPKVVPFLPLLFVRRKGRRPAACGTVPPLPTPCGIRRQRQQKASHSHQKRHPLPPFFMPNVRENAPAAPHSGRGEARSAALAPAAAAHPPSRTVAHPSGDYPGRRDD